MNSCTILQVGMPEHVLHTGVEQFTRTTVNLGDTFEVNGSIESIKTEKKNGIN
jgi:hypothetical protein